MAEFVEQDLPLVALRGRPVQRNGADRLVPDPPALAAIRVLDLRRQDHRDFPSRRRHGLGERRETHTTSSHRLRPVERGRFCQAPRLTPVHAPRSPTPPRRLPAPRCD